MPEASWGDNPAEEYLAALLIRDPDSRETIVDSLRPEMFSSPIPYHVFTAVCSLMVEQLAVDDLALAERLSAHIDSPEITIGILQGQAASPENCDHYVKRVLDAHGAKSTAEALQDALQRLSTRDYESFDQFKAELEDRLLNDQSDAARKTLTCADSYDLIVQAKDHGGLGYSWGIRKLDEATGGIIPGNYYAIGGLKKTGKSLFGVNTIAQLAGNPEVSKRVPCLILSLEMSHHQLNCAFLSHEARVDSRLFGTVEISSEDLSRCREAAQQIDDWPIYVVHQPGMTIEQVIAAIRRHVRLGVRVVLLDYLQRIDIPNRTDNRATAIQKAVNRLADAARKYNVALLLLSQLANRAEFDSEPSVGDFKESGGIAEACDCAMILHNLDRANRDPNAPKTNIFEIGIPVQRIGRSGIKISIKHDLRFARFYDDREIALTSAVKPMRSEIGWHDD